MLHYLTFKKPGDLNKQSAEDKIEFQSPVSVQLALLKPRIEIEETPECFFLWVELPGHAAAHIKMNATYNDGVLRIALLKKEYTPQLRLVHASSGNPLGAA